MRACLPIPTWCLAWLCAGGALVASAATSSPAALAELDYGDVSIPQITITRRNATPQQTVKLLGEALATDNEPAREQHLHELGECELPECEPYLRAAMRDPGSWTRAAAAAAAGSVAAAPLLQALRELRRDADPIVRREAVISLGRLGDSGGIPAAMTDPDPAVRLAAIAAAARCHDLDQFVSSTGALKGAEAAVALQALSRAGTSRATDWAARHLDGSTAERVAAIRCLGEAAAVERAGDIRKFASDSNPIVRRAAVAALGKLLAEPERRLLARAAMGDADPTVREAAVRAFAAAEEPADVPKLIEMLEVDYPPLHEAAIGAIVSAGAGGADAVIPLLTAKNSARRRDASLVLGRTRTRASFDAHVQLLHDADPAVVAQAAESLGEIGDKRTGPALAELAEADIKQADDATAETIARQAIIACGRLGERSILPLVRSVLSDRPSYSWPIRAAAAFAFGRLADPAAPADADVARSLPAIYGDNLEPPPVKLEALKALGQMRFAESLPALRQIVQSEPDPRLRWVAHWAADRISGGATPLAPPTSEWTADTSLAAVGPEASLGFEGVPALSAYYVPGTWTPLRFTLINGTAEPIDGYVRLPLKRGDGEFDVQLPVRVPPRSRLRTDSLGFFSEGAPAPSRSTGPLAVAEWMNRSGQRVARSPITATPLSAARDLAGQSTGGSGDSLLLYVTAGVNGASDSGAQAADPSALARSLGAAGVAVEAVTLNVNVLPRQSAGYDAVRAIALDDVDPDALDMAQRRALMDFVCRGGCLLLFDASPSNDADLWGSWLAAYLPLLRIDQRQAQALDCEQTGTPLALRGWTRVGEAALVPGAKEVLSDRNCVYAGYRAVGGGRVAEVTFAPDALSGDAAQRAAVWQAIAGPPKGGADRRSGGDEQIAAALDRMLGTPTAPWWFAALMTCVYVSLVLGAHVTFGGARAPRAFAATGVTSIVLCGVVAVAIHGRPASRQIQGARLTRVSTGPGGGAGNVQDYFAFLGSDDSIAASAASAETVLEPAACTADADATVNLFPFTISQRSLKPTKFTTVWSGRGRSAEVPAVEASAQFGADGLRLRVTNEGATVADPLFVWGDCFSLPPIRSGEQSVALATANPPGDYTNKWTLPSAETRLRGGAAAAFMGTGDTATTSGSPSPQLIGWIRDDAGAGARTFRTDARVRWSAQTMVQLPVDVRPSPPGSRVKIDSGFVRLLVRASEGLPFDPAKRQWISSTLTGQWLVGFAAPPEVGKVRYGRLAVDLDLDAPRHSVRLRRGQVSGGAPLTNTSGPVIGSWRSVVRPQHVECDLSEEDLDRDGNVWLLLQIDPSDAGPTGDLPSWHVRRLAASLEGTVIGPAAPRATALTASAALAK